MPKYFSLKPRILQLFIIITIINIMVYLTCKYGICSRFQPLNKYPYSAEKMQTNMYRDQIFSADQKSLSTNKPQIFMVIFITNCGDSINDADLTCKYGVCSRFQPLNKYPYRTEKMQTKMYRDQIVSAE